MKVKRVPKDNDNIITETSMRAAKLPFAELAKVLSQFKTLEPRNVSKCYSPFSRHSKRAGRFVEHT